MGDHRKLDCWKKIQSKSPPPETSQAKPLFCSPIKWSINFISSSHKKPSCAFPNASLLSAVYLPFGSKGGGTFSKTGIFAKGSPFISRIILYFPGNSVTTGLTFLATGLYFFFVTTPFLFI